MSLEAHNRFLANVGAPPDESDPVYLKRKAEGAARLKSHFEQIIEKFENMPECMTDEIDMELGRVVVDRGHLKKMSTQTRALNQAEFLEDMLTDRLEEDEDDIDELAPPETETASARAQRIARKTVINTTAAPLPDQNPTPLALMTSMASMPAQLMQQMFLPQTPGGQEGQGQDAARSQLQQLMTNAFSSALQGVIQNITTGTTVPATPTPAVTTAPTPSNPTQLRPGTDPKWYFPVLPERPPRLVHSNSSPSIPLATRKRRSSFTEQARKLRGKSRASRQSESVAAQQSVGRNTPKPLIAQKEEGASKRKRNFKYIFTGDDEAYIIHMKELEKRSWRAIREGRSELNNFPLAAIQKHYYKVRSAQFFTASAKDVEEEVAEADSLEADHMGETNSWHEEEIADTGTDVRPTPEGKRSRAQPMVLIPRKATPLVRHRGLLTPSSMVSSVQANDSQTNQTPPEVVTIHTVENIDENQLAPDIHNSEHRDDESLEEGEEQEADHVQSDREVTVTSFSPDEVLPSIEKYGLEEHDYIDVFPVLEDEVEPQTDTLRVPTTPAQVPKSTRTRSSNRLRNTIPIDIRQHADESETDLDLVPTSSPPKHTDNSYRGTSIETCKPGGKLPHNKPVRLDVPPTNLCSSPPAETHTLPSIKDKEAQARNEDDVPLSSTETTPEPTQAIVATTHSDTEDVDELQMHLPHTPRIKLEPKTPPRISALYGTPRPTIQSKSTDKSTSTPRPNAPLTASSRQDTETPNLSRKRFARQVRASWSKDARKSNLGRRKSGLDLGKWGGGVEKKRRSLPGSGLGARGDETSEDELAG
ncbi:hypothetical protein P154DRAFT_534017 [Amniculicola lignicola CBS 123094]|uniref:Uncharacterized protein n=1 Tax=Amniculicola lignicola CBS 123094 TaxID=1392246 RepID=A0A6A5WU74_9PLEO|nr:hypothetical protein P154DRAFT_534017 [Amniculicola lignicola CBS 123094]